MKAKSLIWKRNPHRAGSKYWKLFDYMQHAGRFTRAEFVDFAMSLGDEYPKAYYNVTVMMSPRKKSTRGSVLGNIAAAGHLYFAEKLDRRILAGDQEMQHYKFRWRPVPLEPLKRKSILRGVLSSERTSNPHAIVRPSLKRKTIKTIKE